MSFSSLLSEWSASLYIPSFLQAMTDGVRVPLIPVRAREMGASDTTVGVVVGMAGLAKALLDLCFGFATSYFGTGSIMILGMLINTIGALVVAFSFNPVLLGAGSFLCGMGIAAFFVARHVFIANAVPRGIRGRSMSIIGGTARWAVVFGPVCSGVLMDFCGSSIAALSIIPISVSCAVYIYKSEQVQDVDAKRRYGVEAAGGVTHEMKAMGIALKRYWDIVLRLGVYSFNILSLRQARRLLLVLAGVDMGLSVSIVGLIVALSFVVDALLFFLGGYIMDRFGRKYAAIPTSLNLGIGFFFLRVSTTPLSLVLSALFFGLADSTGAGILMTLTADHSPPSGGAPFMGLMRTLQDAGQAVGPILCGVIIEHLNFSWACAYFGMTGLLNALWAFLMIPTKSASEIEEEEEERGAKSPAVEACDAASDESQPVISVVMQWEDTRVAHVEDALNSANKDDN